MPLKGYKSVTVTEEIYGILKFLAQNDHRSISKETEYLVLLERKKRTRKKKAEVKQ